MPRPATTPLPLLGSVAKNGPGVGAAANPSDRPTESSSAWALDGEASNTSPPGAAGVAVSTNPKANVSALAVSVNVSAGAASSAPAPCNGARPAAPATSRTTPMRVSTRVRMSGFHPEVGGEDLLLAELVGLADELHAALGEDVDEVGQFQGPADVLLHQQQRGALGGEAAQVLEDLVDDLGRQPHGDLVEEHRLRPRQVGAGQGQH